MAINHNKPLFLSNGTQVRYSKHTTKGNIQVTVPDSDPIGAADPKRIFRPDGTHYKDALNGVTLSNTVPAAAPAPAPVAAGTVDRNRPMFLSDGTPVEFVKVTSKRNIQVRVPSSHALGAADPLRIFRPTTGAHYKGNTGGLFLTNNAPAVVATATAAAAPTSGGTFALKSGGNLIDDGFDTIETATAAALAEIASQGGTGSVEIVQQTYATVRTVTIR